MLARAASDGRRRRRAGFGTRAALAGRGTPCRDSALREPSTRCAARLERGAVRPGLPPLLRGDGWLLRPPLGLRAEQVPRPRTSPRGGRGRERRAQAPVRGAARRFRAALRRLSSPGRSSALEQGLAAPRAGARPGPPGTAAPALLGRGLSQPGRLPADPHERWPHGPTDGTPARGGAQAAEPLVAQLTRRWARARPLVLEDLGASPRPAFPEINGGKRRLQHAELMREPGQSCPCGPRPCRLATDRRHR